MDVTKVAHETTVSAPASTIYDIVADVGLWPLYFPPTVHAERISGTDDAEQIRIWAMANGELRTWVSQRHLDPTARTVAFEQVEPTEPVAYMGGVWRIDEAEDGTCPVVLEHSYRAVDDDPINLERIDWAVATNSGSELESLKHAAETTASLPELTLTFADSEVVTGTLEEAYDFIYDLDQWPDRIPHVQRMVVTEDVPGLQVMEMDTKSPDGSVHTTESGRVCLAPNRIVYKQTRTGGLLRSHTGEWRFEPEGDGKVRITSVHRVILDPDAIAKLPEPPATMDDAREAIRNALGTNSRVTMATAKAYLEDR